KGEVCFWIEEDGDYEIRFRPYRVFSVQWEHTRFEVSPDDTLLDKLPSGSAANRGLLRMFDAVCWDTLRRNLDDPAFPYGDLLRRGFDWALQCEDDNALPMLAASVRLRRDTASLEHARRIIARVLALPAWGGRER